MLNLFIILILKMSISIHIPFYNPNPEKKEGYRNLTRFDYLKENILSLKKTFSSNRYIQKFKNKNLLVRKMVTQVSNIKEK